MEDTLTDYCDRCIVGKLIANNLGETSDDRLKFNETPIINASQIIKQLNPVVYDKSKVLNVEEDTFKEAGLIAQEVLNTDISFCVTGGDYTDFFGNKIEHPYDVNYNSILAYLISGFQEQQKLIEELIAHIK